MKYSTDKPIDNEDGDLLGRSFFSKQLGKAVYEFNAEDGLVIGLFGKWGTGKTSVINMAENEINELAKKNNKNPLIMRFSPWNYSDKDNLISLFFQSLKNELNVSNNEVLKNKIGKVLNDYAGAFDSLSIIPMFGTGIAALLKNFAQVQGSNLMEAPSLDITKKKLENKLRESEDKIIIVIDDIDRLTNSQIRDIFQLVKQVADFPNVIYILVMDRDIVCRALTDVHNVDGNEYLEKIIQIPFEIPEIKISKLHDILFKKLNQIIEDSSISFTLDEDYWYEVFTNCISPYINTLRDVNRFVNTFQFKYNLLFKETSLEDMLGITALEVFEPKLYKWIYSNKDIVCDGNLDTFLSDEYDKPDYRKMYYDKFKNMGINPDLAINCVSTMFPAFLRSSNKYQDYTLKSDLIGKMRVAHKGRFELYFMFDLDDIKVSRNFINKCIFELNIEKLYHGIREINENGNIIYFLEELKALSDNIPYNRLHLILSVILDLHGEFEGESSNGIFSLPACDIAYYFIEKNIKKITNEVERYEIISDAVRKVDKIGLAFMAKIINCIELSYGRLAGDSENKEGQIISLSHLIELEKIYVERARIIMSRESISDINRFFNAFYLWDCFDKDKVSEYISSLSESKVDILKFICSTACSWRSGNIIRWSFNLSDYSKYFSKEYVYELIENFGKNNINKFTEIEKVKLASFVLYYSNDKMEHVNEENAKTLVSQWELENV